MLYIIGDLHLSAMNPWNYEIGEKFISWFSEWVKQINQQDNNPNIIWLGDITEKDVNPGDVIDQEYRIFDLCSKHFKSTYVVMGNHDLKLYRQQLQHSLKFLKNFPNVYVCENVTEINLSNTKIRVFPHLRITGETLYDYYSNMTFDSDVDLTVGHWNKFDPKMPIMGGVKIDNMKSKHFALGHIHDRIDNDYTGSVFANKKSEHTNRGSVIKVFDNGALIKEIDIPKFVSYESVQYPELIPSHNDNIVHIYEVSGITNITLAKSFYKNNYIKGVIFQKRDKEGTQFISESEKESSNIFKKDVVFAFNEWLKETKYPITRKAAMIITEIFSKKKDLLK